MKAGSTTTLKLKLPASVVSDLLRHARQSVKLTLLATNPTGASRATSQVSPLKT